MLYHKKFKNAEVTIEKTNRKEKIQGLVGLVLLGLAIWYFTK
ncbi:hypothetical protein [Streptococcus pluranimalium]